MGFGATEYQVLQGVVRPLEPGILHAEATPERTVDVVGLDHVLLQLWDSLPPWETVSSTRCAVTEGARLP